MSKIGKAASHALNALLGVTLLLALSALQSTPVRAAPAHLSAVSDVVAQSSRQSQLSLDTSAASTVTTTARRGEGVIRITTRVCGSSSGWQSVASANGIRPPVYLVLLGQSLRVTCGGSTSAPRTSSNTQPAVTTSSGWTAPLAGCIVGVFGEQRPGHIHAGVDISAGYGTAIHAIAAGTVSVGWQAGGAGNYTMINHGNGVWSVYMHQSSFAVRSGHVNAGQVIGYVGATGNATGPHLHFEIHTTGLWSGKTDPQSFLRNRGVSIGCR